MTDLEKDPGVLLRLIPLPSRFGKKVCRKFTENFLRNFRKFMRLNGNVFHLDFYRHCFTDIPINFRKGTHELNVTIQQSCHYPIRKTF